jgi:hypothetical protein
MQNELEKRIIDLEKRVSELEKKNQNSPTSTISPEREKKVSIKEFLVTKKLDDDVKRTLAIAYFLEHIEKNESLNTEDLKQGFQLAKCPLPKNINDKVNMNIKNAHMMETGEKKNGTKAWVLTASGEQFVEVELSK